MVSTSGGIGAGSQRPPTGCLSPAGQTAGRRHAPIRGALPLHPVPPPQPLQYTRPRDGCKAESSENCVPGGQSGEGSTSSGTDRVCCSRPYRPQAGGQPGPFSPFTGVRGAICACFLSRLLRSVCGLQGGGPSQGWLAYPGWIRRRSAARLTRSRSRPRLSRPFGVSRIMGVLKKR